MIGAGEWRECDKVYATVEVTDSLGLSHGLVRRRGIVVCDGPVRRRVWKQVTPLSGPHSACIVRVRIDDPRGPKWTGWMGTEQVKRMSAVDQLAELAG